MSTEIGRAQISKFEAQYAPLSIVDIVEVKGLEVSVSENRETENDHLQNAFNYKLENS